MIFEVENFILPKGCSLVVCGNCEILGNWDIKNALSMKCVCFHKWSTESVSLPNDKNIEYKIVAKKSDGCCVWEDGYNRTLTSSENTDVIVVEPRIKVPSVFGIVVPVFSLRSKSSWGVGDFGDLKKLVDFAVSKEMGAIQMLPINDTTRTKTWKDSYPYSGISAFALHPLYVNLNELIIKDNDTIKKIKVKAQKLNKLPLLDYAEALKIKEEYLKLYFEENHSKILKSDEYKSFVSINKYWLESYCIYRVLQDYMGTSDFRTWGNISNYDEKKVRKWILENKKQSEVDFYSVVQFILYKQLQSIHNYATSLGVLLKGDLPVGLNRDSVDCWVHPEYFNFEYETGAPPDYFSSEGQNWGFPTYNWHNIFADDCIWWKKRLENMELYFDAFRIDHVLGFFRIWEIPAKHHNGKIGHFSPCLPLNNWEIKQYGFKADTFKLTTPDKFGRSLFVVDDNNNRCFNPVICGRDSEAYKTLCDSDRYAYDKLFDDYFYHRHEAFWAAQGGEKLSMLKSFTNMLTCAEDLGMVPDCVPYVLNQIGILSLRIQTMPLKSWEHFSNLNDNPRLSVATITTHDMPTMRLWWKNNRELAKEYYYNELQMWGETPEEMTPEIACKIIFNHKKSPSMLCLVSIQDWMAMDNKFYNPNIEEEQINHPEVANHYWRYRMHINIEDLMCKNK